MTAEPADLATRLFEQVPQVRYVAVCLEGEPLLAQRPGLGNASTAESDWYEEVLVNPTLLTLARRRGEIDCGGLEYILVRYGRFFQLIYPCRSGHISVAIEPTDALIAVVATIIDLVDATHG